MSPRFVRSEIAMATGLPPTAIEDAVKAGIAPPSISSGRGSAHKFDTHGLVAFAVAGAIYEAGVEPTASCLIGFALCKELRAQRCFVPDSIESASYPNKLTDWPEFDEEGRLDRFELYCGLLNEHPQIKFGDQSKSDLVLEIVNRQFVFSRGDERLKILSPAFTEPTRATPEFKLSGWERGSRNVVVVHPWEDDEAPFTKTAIEYEAAYLGAVSILAVNVSLSIRRAFGRMFDIKRAKGAV